MDGPDRFRNWIADAAGGDQLAHLSDHGFTFGFGLSRRVSSSSDRFVFVDGWSAGRRRRSPASHDYDANHHASLQRNSGAGDILRIATRVADLSVDSDRVRSLGL